MTKHHLKGRGHWSGHVNHLNLEDIKHISRTAKAKVVKFCKQVGYVM